MPTQTLLSNPSPPVAGRVRLYDVAPDLRPDRPTDDEPVVAVFRLAVGAAAEPPGSDFLVLKGLVLRELSVCGRETAELIGPGDVLQSWRGEDVSIVNSSVRWRVLEPTLIAELGALAGRSEKLLAQTVSRAQAAALERTIAANLRVEVRVLAYLWHLADRFGVVATDGVRLDLPLTHALLAQLVCARRPTVTSALQRLIRAGYLRRDRRAFVLLGDVSAIETLED